MVNKTYRKKIAHWPWRGRRRRRRRRKIPGIGWYTMGPTKSWVLWKTNKESKKQACSTLKILGGGGKEMGSYLQKPVSHQGFDNVFQKTFQRTDIASLREAHLFLLFNFS